MTKFNPCGKRASKTDRRRFLRNTLCAGAGLMAAPGFARASRASGKLRLRVVYALSSVVQPKPDWPNLGFDFAPVMEKYNQTLANAFPDIEFLPATAKGAAKAMSVLTADAGRGIDGYIVLQLNSWKTSILPISAVNKPVLFAPFMYGGTGGFQLFNSMFLRQHKKNVGFVSSSNMDDLLEAIKCFKAVKAGGRSADFGAAVSKVRMARTPGPGDLTCVADPLPQVSMDDALGKMKESKILAVGYPGVSLKTLPFIAVQSISFNDLNAAQKAADQDQAREIAARWRKAAAAVKEVSDPVLEDCAAMYLGMKDLLKKHRANAITVNCLVGVYGGLTKSYPCLGFHELCNEGLVGACECDVRSAGTMLAVNALTNGRPGFISDPALDTATRRIIYAHCVASNRPFGPKGPANPFEILTHSEDRKGASVRSILPAGYMTTTLEIHPDRKEILFHQAKAVGNDPDDRACRTKLVAEPIGDFEKLFKFGDQWGWHRVTVYGDLKESVSGLAERLGYKVVSEA